MPKKKLEKEFQKRIISWYKKNGRVFYWRTRKSNLWQWLVLESLLKRTRAETVEKIFPKFITKYFEPSVVVQASKLELENDLKYLGLYKQRQIALRRIAEKIVSDFNGRIPSDQPSLVKMPHVGPYISNAVLCFGDDQRKAIVDTNIARVLTRFQGLDVPKDAREEWIWKLAEKMLPQENCQEYNFGLIDIGATICKIRVPKCSLCFLKDMCSYVRKSNEKIPETESRDN